ncbi:MAG: hypothetical protein J2P27_15360 [Actinobacteria bacterium]|nr:hypothetical protein [Actinomycetota bacterium]
MAGDRPAPGGSPDASKVIAEAAKQALAPLGVKRKGRSRTWLDDHGWWVGVVEFQPSNWEIGAYLNVGLMFLWRPIDYFAFEIGYRVDDFSPASDADAFHRAIQAKAAKARDEVTSLRERFASVRGVIRHYQQARKKMAITDHAHLGAAWGLTGDMERCRSSLDQALELREQARSGAWRASAWMLEARQAATDEGTFRAWVQQTMNTTRAALKLSSEPVEPPKGQDPG